MVNARTSRAEAQETVDIIQAAGGRAALHLADITNAPEVAGMVQTTMGHFGRLDFLVNNAATRIETPFAEIALEEWHRVLSVVLDGAFLCSQACLPHLGRSGRGAIVNIGGLSAFTGAIGRAHVVAAKAGLAGLTRALALELAPQGITVNCVVPGTIETTRDLPGVPARPAHRSFVPPVGRRGGPEEVAALVRMLCGPDARYMTGQSLHLNGGGFMS